MTGLQKNAVLKNLSGEMVKDDEEIAEHLYFFFIN